MKNFFKLVGLITVLALFSLNVHAQWTDTGNNEIYYNSGKVGVGLSDPAAILHVYENNGIQGAGAGIKIEQDGSGSSILQFSLTGVKSWILGIDNSDADKFKISEGIGFGSDDHFVIDKDGKVGIGIPSPLYSLDVIGSINAPKYRVNGEWLATSWDRRIRIKGKDTPDNGGEGLELGYDPDLNEGILIPIHRGPNTFGDMRYNAASHLFQIESSDVMKISSAGNVGIGTLTPDYPFEIESNFANNNGEKILAAFNNSTNDGGVYLSYVGDGTDAKYATIRSGGTIPLSIGTSTKKDALYIKNSGDVGIGTISPRRKLDVQGQVFIEDDLDSKTGQLFIGHENSYLQRTGTELSLTSYNRKLKFDVTGNNKQIEFHTDSELSMLIDDLGRVGIGKPDPGHNLDVAGTVNATNYLLNGAPLQSWSQNGSDIDFSNGNVGITSGDLYLNTHGKKVIYKNGGKQWQSYVNPNNSDEFYITRSQTTGPEIKIYSDNANYSKARLHIGDNTIINNAGTSTFNNDVNVLGTVDASNFLINGQPLGTNWDARLQIRSNDIPSSGQGVEIGYDSNIGEGVILSYNRDAELDKFRDLRFNASKHTFQIDGNNSFMIDENGNVGIGTTGTYSNELVVNGTAKSSFFILSNKELNDAQDVTGEIYFDENYQSSYPEFTGGNGGGLSVKNEDGWGALIATNNMQWLTPTFDGGQFNGNVAIGTAISNHKLDVSGNINGSDYFLNGKELEWSWARRLQISSNDIPGSGKGVEIGFDSNIDEGVIASYSRDNSTYLNMRYNSKDHLFQVSGSNKMIIDETGKVGIGTSSPDELLTVDGTIHAERVKVTLDVEGPDYVFEEDYDLMSLENTSKYIKENKHLPHVPSAKEMKEQGVNVGNMNMILLRKVEELTLYILEQNDKIKDQDARMIEQNELINTLINKVEELENQ